jgi:hypothetical protein
MKIKLSAMALGGVLAFVSQFATAQLTPTVTVSQSGTGNTAAAEQFGFAPGYGAVATIIQTGNGNHVGGPGGTTSGIIQSNSTGAVVKVTQNGTGNNVGVLQTDDGVLPPNLEIAQTGNANSAVVNQSDSSGTDIFVKQSGSGNATSITQNAADSEVHVTQTGANNSATVVDRFTGLFFGPIIEQNGEGNTVTATALNNGFSDHTITQTGLRNNAITNQFNASFSSLAIRQLGADNQANITQAGDNQSATINQNGSGNLASINQDGFSLSPDVPLIGNTALITQAGTNNNATIRQAGDAFASTVNQSGSGNYASVYQH